MKRLVLLLLPVLAASPMAAAVNWPEALQGIAAGEQIWLDKVPHLAAVADVKQAIALEDALSSSLVKNTQGTLGILSLIDAKSWPHMIGTEIVCGVPVEQSAAMVEDFYQQTRHALLSTDKGATCLWLLEASYEEWQADNARKVK
ncbi:hypothetical protein NG99_19530 [Erwinia typographi]|uniref:Uncharacterized protein n=1 Tax=Erwinia typographi TaxID=371042 RepID=A0A0A3YVZ8_9GAMM|nr:hypothetical protein [Erwinia typographi]KGT89521.1 hypothetical protein NG99_19530 [Erwinia typographi]